MRVRVQTVRLMRRIWLAMVATVLVIGAGISAHAALRGISARNDARDRAMVAADTRAVSSPMPVADQETAAPAAGVTGTIDLPDLPIPAGAVLDAGVVPARPAPQRRPPLPQPQRSSAVSAARLEATSCAAPAPARRPHSAD